MDGTSKSFEAQLAEALRENRELKHKLAAAQSSAEELQQFIYAAAHDLRQPLRTIHSYAQLLQRQFAKEKEAIELTSLTVGAAADVNALIDDLLTYSRVGMSPNRTMVSLAPVAQSALLKLESVIRESGAQITYADLPEVAVDEPQFTQLFHQLFSNALKFRSVEPPKIEVTAEEQPESYVISVRDNGQGIEPRFHQQVFQPFKRLHGNEIPGTGLGLALCRKIVQAHGGTIWVESDGQHGSVFKFTVPL